jgi:N-acetylmuramoyl-L-alanine amidase
MAVKQYSASKDGNKKLSQNFTVREFACKDGSDKVLIDDNLVNLLQRIRNHYGKPVNINSAYRTTSHNKRVGGASNSQHLYGTAADIWVEGVTPRNLAQYATFLLTNVMPSPGGVGLYSWGAHVDTRGYASYWPEYCGTGGNTDPGSGSGDNTIVVAQEAKVYLSPSLQPENIYSYGNTNEAVQCQKIADQCGEILQSYGVPVKVGTQNQNLSQRISESNNFGATVHIPIHTNAGGGTGAMVMCTSANTKNPFVVNIYNNLCGLQPNADRGIVVRTDLGEINNTRAICVYCECEFHDNQNDAKFIVENTDKIAQAIAGGVLKSIGKDTTNDALWGEGQTAPEDAANGDSDWEATWEDVLPELTEDDLRLPFEEVDPTIEEEVEQVEEAKIIRHKYTVIDGNIWMSVGEDTESGTVWSDLVNTGQSYRETENLLVFNNVVNGQYYIKAQTQYVYNDFAITCVDDDGNNYTEQIENFDVTSKPQKWNWDKYTSKNGGYTALCSSSYLPISNKEVQPITASTWNRFTERINHVRMFRGLDTIVFSPACGKSNYSTESSGFTSAIYNEAADAINDLGGNIPRINPGTVLSAQLFLDLKDELNNIIDTL